MSSGLGDLGGVVGGVFGGDLNLPPDKALITDFTENDDPEGRPPCPSSPEAMTKPTGEGNYVKTLTQTRNNIAKPSITHLWKEKTFSF
jgi:hypothetical protein